jgi:hypothetical protein
MKLFTIAGLAVAFLAPSVFGQNYICIDPNSNNPDFSCPTKGVARCVSCALLYDLAIYTI